MYVSFWKELFLKFTAEVHVYVHVYVPIYLMHIHYVNTGLCTRVFPCHHSLRLSYVHTHTHVPTNTHAYAHTHTHAHAYAHTAHAHANLHFCIRYAHIKYGDTQTYIRIRQTKHTYIHTHTCAGAHKMGEIRERQGDSKEEEREDGLG